MGHGWIPRRSHSRRLPDGRTTEVRASWVLQHSPAEKKRRSLRHQCPLCGAEVISVQMPNGGRAHFEGGKGLSRIKHPCLHLGERLSRKRDENTADLFNSYGDQEMPKYREVDGDSGVIGYEYGPDWIEVEFEKGTSRFYRYTYLSAGSDHVEKLKGLADAGEGLNSYINRYVARRYASKH
jgi:hypothetical protein